jgi:Na+-transporting methylmalonyl-CoA/oxaloacetate decarboxylase gamma subunit
MGVDWGFAGQVGGAGFGMVFLLLIILAIVVWLTGRLVNKTSRTKDDNDDNRKGA